jgi:hypothetical protein
MKALMVAILLMISMNIYAECEENSGVPHCAMDKANAQAAQDKIASNTKEIADKLNELESIEYQRMVQEGFKQWD